MNLEQQTKLYLQYKKEHRFDQPLLVAESVLPTEPTPRYNMKIGGNLTPKNTTERSTTPIKSNGILLNASIQGIEQIPTI